MPITNGNAVKGHDLLPGEKKLDYTTALEVLKREYKSRDGLDIHTLLDSAKNGGLTYNDFLVLPGYIGNYISRFVKLTHFTFRSSASITAAIAIRSLSEIFDYTS
jgi:hypothetical protein